MKLCSYFPSELFFCLVFLSFSISGGAFLLLVSLISPSFLSSSCFFLSSVFWSWRVHKSRLSSFRQTGSAKPAATALQRYRCPPPPTPSRHPRALQPALSLSCVKPAIFPERRRRKNRYRPSVQLGFATTKLLYFFGLLLQSRTPWKKEETEKKASPTRPNRIRHTKAAWPWQNALIWKSWKKEKTSKDPTGKCPKAQCDPAGLKMTSLSLNFFFSLSLWVTLSVFPIPTGCWLLLRADRRAKPGELTTFFFGQADFQRLRMEEDKQKKKEEEEKDGIKNCIRPATAATASTDGLWAGLDWRHWISGGANLGRLESFSIEEHNEVKKRRKSWSVGFPRDLAWGKLNMFRGKFIISRCI